MVTTATDVQIPSGLPVLPGAVLSGRYVLSGVEPLNKGDTLDAMPLPGRKVALVVADVVGTGFGAAVAVSQIKAILRERLRAGAGLLAAMSSADSYARIHSEVCATTACVAILGLDDGELEWTTAGHPPPIWVSQDGEPRTLATAPTRPLGTGGHNVTHRTRLAAGEMVVLYTNGLVAFEGSTLAEGYRRLFSAVSTAAADTVGTTSATQAGDQMCERILRGVLPDEGSGDDAALLIATRSLPQESFVLNTEAVPENLPRIRHRINEWLDGLGAGLIDHIGLGHAVVELAANVIAHAYVGSPTGDAMVRIAADLEHDGQVSITVSDRGRWREHESSGRGLMMAAGLVDTIRVNRSEHGTSVTVTQHLTRPVPLLQQVPPAASATTFDESQELHTRAEPGHLVATGPVDDLSVEIFHAALTEATRAGTDDAVVDLSGVTHLGSPGVQAIFEFVGHSKRTGSTLSLEAPSDSPAGQILHLVDLAVTG